MVSRQRRKNASSGGSNINIPCAHTRAARRTFAAHKLSDFLGRRQLQRLAIHAEFFRPNGVEYELELGLPAPPWHTKVFGFDSGSRDFGERDRLLLDLVRPHLVHLYESAKKRGRLAAALAAGTEASGELVVLELRRPGARICEHRRPPVVARLRRERRRNSAPTNDRRLARARPPSLERRVLASWGNR